MLDLRLYRVTLLPFVLLLIVAAFSLHARPAPLAAAPPPQTFDTATAAATMNSLAAAYRQRSPGSAADDALAEHLAGTAAPNGLAGAGFTSVRVVSSDVETTGGEATVRNVIATRAGTGAGGGIALIADRGSSQQDPAALAPTATLLELASIYKELVPARSLTLVSTSGGASAMEAVAGLLPPDTEAAIVIGDIADGSGRGPYVVPWSASGAVAPVQLRLAVEGALRAALARPVGDLSLPEEMARLALPLTTGAQGLLGAAGIPAVLVGADGESQPGRHGADVAVLGAFGQGLLGVTSVLDGTSVLPTAPTRDLSFGTQLLDGWAVRALIGALLLSLAACTLDVLARARRRRVAVARPFGWALSFAAPFVLAGVFAAFLGAGGLLPATPLADVTPAQLPVSAEGVAALVSIGLLFVLAWVLWAAALARRGRRRRPDAAGAAAGLLALATVTAALLWLQNPYTAALLILPAHLWLVVLTREHGRPRLLGAVCVAVSLVPLIAAVGLICSVLRIEPFALLWTLVLMIAGGALSPAGLVLASLTAGSFVAAASILVRGEPIAGDERVEVTVRGPLSYAGPGSLGGTESALRR